MKFWVVLIFSMFLFSCKSPEGNLKEIEVGGFVFNFPNAFHLKEEKGIDSYVGRITNDSITIGFDYGNYSNKLVETPQEYLTKPRWTPDPATKFMKEGIRYDDANMPKVDILTTRLPLQKDSLACGGCDYLAECVHEGEVFTWPIYLPKEIKEHTVKIDTVHGLYRRIVIANDPQNGITGIYMRRLDSFNKYINGYLALSMATSNLTKEQQGMVVKILMSGKEIIKPE